MAPVDELALTPEQATELAPLQAQPRPTRPRGRFVQLPYEQALRAAGQLRNVHLAVLVELAYQVFRTHQNPVPLTNTALRAAGFRRDAKLRALRELEGVGLVAVSWRGRKCPMVTLLWR